MKVLFVALRNDYGDPQRGDSFEYTNFFDTLRRMQGVEAELFPFDQVAAQRGQVAMNQALVERVRDWDPALVFFFFFKDEIDINTVSTISSLTQTVNWFADDQWRFETYSRHWSPYLRWIATTYPPAAEGYRRLGHMGVIPTQWGCNHFLYRPLGLERDADVSFVGQPHGDRPATIDRLRQEGLKVEVWGYGWETGRLEQDEMIRLFCRSKINLNLSNAASVKGLRQLAGLFLQRRGGMILPRGDWRPNLKELLAKRKDQIKGRNFEIPGCRTFLLTNRVDGLDAFFEDGKEVVMFSGLDDLVEKAHYYLSARDEREEIAERGYQRVLKEHTYEARFREMFRMMGLQE